LFIGLLVYWFIGLLVYWFIGLLVCWFVGYVRLVDLLVGCWVADGCVGVSVFCRTLRALFGIPLHVWVKQSPSGA
jgi:hypothetical protein